MADTKFTKGPWRVLEGKYGLQIHSEKHWIANVKCESCPVSEEANAHLIAAAPTMAEYIKFKADGGCLDAMAIWEGINAR